MPRVETTICPHRVLRDRPEITATLDWFLWSMEREAMGGTPIGIREWPYPGGIMAQPAKLVAAAQFLLAEWGHLPGNEPAGRRKRED